MLLSVFLSMRHLDTFFGNVWKKRKKQKKRHLLPSNNGLIIPRKWKYKEELPITSKKRKGLIQLCKQLNIPRQDHLLYFNLKSGSEPTASDAENDDDFGDYRGETDDEIWQ